MIELVELLGQLIAVVCYAAWRIVFSGLLHYGSIPVHLLYQLRLLLVERHVGVEILRQLHAFSLGLTQDAAYAGVCILNERARVAVEVDALFRIEEHVLACVNLQYEVFQRAQTHDACNLVALLFGHILELAELVACLACILYHLCYEVVGVHHCSLAALHLAVGQFHHAVGEVHKFLAPLESEAVEQY